jgi:WD40 repeat protein
VAQLEAEQKTREAQFKESEMLATSSAQRAAAGDLAGARRLALDALPKDEADSRPYVPQAELALYAAVHSENRGASLSFEGGAKRAVFSADGERLVAVTDSNVVYVWDAKTGEERSVLHFEIPKEVLLDDDGNIAVVTDHSDETRVHDLVTGRLLPITIEGTPIAVSPGGAFVLAQGGDVLDESVQVWNVATSAILLEVETDDTQFDAAVDRSGSRIAFMEDDSLVVWSVPEKRRIWTADVERADRVAFSGDGERLLVTTGFGDERVRVFDAATGEIRLEKDVGSFQAHVSEDLRHVLTHFGDIGGEESGYEVSSIGSAASKKFDCQCAEEAISGDGSLVLLEPFGTDGFELRDRVSGAVVRKIDPLGFEPKELLLSRQGAALVGLGYGEGRLVPLTGSASNSVALRDTSPESLQVLSHDPLVLGVRHPITSKTFDLWDPRENPPTQVAFVPLVYGDYVYADQGRSVVSSENPYVSGTGWWRVRATNLAQPDATREWLTLGPPVVSPAGDVLAMISSTGALEVFAFASGAVMLPSNEGRTPIATAFHPSRRLLAVAWREGGISWVDLERASAWTPLRDESTVTTALTFAADEPKLATLTAAGAVRVISYPAGEILAETTFDRPGLGGTMPEAGVESIERYFDTLADTAELEYEGIEDGVQIRRAGRALFSVANGPSGSPMVEGRGSRLVAVEGSGSVSVWDTSSGSRVAKFEAGVQNATAVAITPDGKAVALGTDEGEVVVFRTVDGAISRTLGTFQSEVGAVAFDASGGRIAASSGPTEIRVWEVEAGTQIASFPDVIFLADRLAFDSSGRRLFGLSMESAIQKRPDGESAWYSEGWIGDLATARSERLSWEMGTVGASIAFGLERDEVVVEGEDGTTIVWNPMRSDPSSIFEPMLGTDVRATSADRRLVAVAKESIVEVIDRETGEVRARLEGHAGRIRAARFSPDARLLLTASDDRTARIWRLDQGASIGAILHGDSVVDAIFIPSLQRVATIAEDGRMRLFPYYDSVFDLIRTAAVIP